MNSADNIDCSTLVSVVIPTFNRPLIARRSVASALAQTVSNIEVIVVDDCSDQVFRVRDAISSLADDRVRYICHTSSKGPSATRNTGIAAARGQYVAFLDDDDVWFERKLEKQLDHIKTGKACLCAFVSQNGINCRKGTDAISLRELRRSRDFGVCSGLLLRTDLARSLRFDEDLRVGEDMDLLFRILRTDPILYLDEPLFFVDVGEHKRISNEGKGDERVLKNRLAFISKNTDSYGGYWASANTAMILLRDFESSANKASRIFTTYKRCGFFPTSHVLFSKFLKRLSRFW